MSHSVLALRLRVPVQMAGGFLIAALLLSSLGCAQEECSDGEERCDGNSALRCSGREYGSRWLHQDCGALACVSVQVNQVAGQVVQARAAAFCAESARPDPRCSEPDVENCAGAALVSCRGGFATSESTCASRCVTLDGLADFCLESAPGNPNHCLNVGSDSRCELVSDGFSAQTGTAPGADCAGGRLDAASTGQAASSAQVYSTHCIDGILLERQRCSSACVFNADCTTQCAD
ncbi:MAG: hypothetical protein ABI488_01205 [Polyangiaceae bacterium]